jgi:hypothetical protein
LHSVYLQFNLHEDAELLAIRLREIGPTVNNELKPFSHAVEIPRDKFDAYVEAITEGGFEKAILHVVHKYIPRQGETKGQLLELSKRSPLQFLVNRQLTDYKGRVVAIVGSLEEDMVGNMVYQTAQNMSFSSVFLDSVMGRLIERYSLTATMLVDYLYRSLVFQEDKKKILERGLEAYLKGNYIVAAHLLIPQVEDAIRNLVEMSGGVVLKRGRGGGFHLTTFDELLRDEIVEEAFGEDLSFYLRVLFTDQRGWNLRNDVCHGVLPSESFQKHTVDRIFHALLCIAQLREQQNET